MNRQGAFLICLLVALAVSVNAAEDKPKKTKDSRIVNGRFIKIDEAPYMVQLREPDGFFFCGGSLVTPQHVISAAHCVRSVKPKDIVIVAGTSFSDGMGEERRIIKTHVPPTYDPNNSMSANDIVVFKLDKPMPMNGRIKTIQLCDKPLTAGTMGQVSGWGAKRSGGPAARELNAVSVPIVATGECNQLYKSFAPVYGSMFCAAYLDRAQDSCQGDSGGPFVINAKLCGVVSWGRGCARSDSPGVYTSIEYMNTFITQALRD